MFPFQGLCLHVRQTRPAQTAPGAFVDSNGAQLHYEGNGMDEMIVLLHVMV